MCSVPSAIIFRVDPMENLSTGGYQTAKFVVFAKFPKTDGLFTLILVGVRGFTTDASPRHQQ